MGGIRSGPTGQALLCGGERQVTRKKHEWLSRRQERPVRELEVERTEYFNSVLVGRRLVWRDLEKVARDRKAISMWDDTSRVPRRV